MNEFQSEAKRAALTAARNQLAILQAKRNALDHEIREQEKKIRQIDRQGKFL